MKKSKLSNATNSERPIGACWIDYHLHPKGKAVKKRKQLMS